MTRARNDYIYRLIGKIYSKGKRKGKDQYQGTYYYQLNVVIENNPKIEKIFAFPAALENKAVWKSIENNHYLDKKYLFFCKNYQGSYRLIDWKELTNHD